MKAITFKPIFKEEILNDEKWLTLRYDPSIVPKEGEEIYLAVGLDSFAIAEVHWVTDITIGEFANKGWEGHTDYESVDHAINNLSNFYPASELKPSTTLKLIGFEVKREV